MSPLEEKSEEDKALKELEKELGTLAWAELAEHLAKDTIIVVSSGIKLLEVGLNVIRDEKEAIKSLIENDLIQKPSETQIESWQKENPKFICLVARPFILVQLMA